MRTDNEENDSIVWKEIDHADVSFYGNTPRV